MVYNNITSIITMNNKNQTILKMHIDLKLSDGSTIKGSTKPSNILESFISKAKKLEKDAVEFNMSSENAKAFLFEYNNENNTLRNFTDIVFSNEYVDITALLNIKMPTKNINSMIDQWRQDNIIVKYKDIKIKIRDDWNKINESK